jgi:hypothetical protein
VVAAEQVPSDLHHRLDALVQRVDAAVAGFHAELEQVKRSLPAAGPGSALTNGSAAGDAAGGDSIRSYEYGLLLNSQQTADRVIRIARVEAERILTDADAEVRTLEARIATLAEAERELQERVGRSLLSS